MADSDPLKAALLRFAAGNATDSELEIVHRALQKNQITLAADERAVAVGGNINDTIIVTGDENVVLVIQNRQLVDRLWEGLARTKYLEGVIRRYGSVTLPIDPTHSFSLQAIFQPLKLRRDPLAIEDLAHNENQAILGELRHNDKDPRRVLPTSREFREQVWQAPPIVIAENGDEALKKSPKHSIVVLGGPGTGKTTLLQYLVSDRAKKALIDPTSPLPIFISLPDLARLNKTLKEYLISVVQDMMVDERYAQVLWNAIEQGQAFVCLDSLDEVAPRLRPERIRLINEWATSTQSTYVIGSRFTDYKGGLLGREQFSEWELMPLDAEARRMLAQNLTPIMHHLIYLNSGVTVHVRAGQGFVEALQSHPTVAAWGENPLLFSLAQYVFTKRGDLPASRAELYAEIVNAVLTTREPDPDQRWERTLLYSEIALLLFQNNSRVFSREDLRVTMRQALRRLGYQSTPDDVAIYVTALVASGLLDSVAHETYGFRHQTLQEYLVGAALAYWQTAPPNADEEHPGQMMADTTRKLVLEKATRARWSEPIRLMIGIMTRSKPPRSTQLAGEWVTTFAMRNVTHLGDPGYLYLALALRCLGESNDSHLIKTSGIQAVNVWCNTLFDAVRTKRERLSGRLQQLTQEIVRLSPALIEVAVKVLVAALQDNYQDGYRHYPIREAAEKALSEFGEYISNDAQQSLITALSNDDFGVRRAAAKVLGTLRGHISNIGQEALVAALADAYYDNYNHYPVREAAAQALGNLGEHLSGVSQQALIAALADSDSKVREAATQVLGEHLSEEQWLSFLADTNWDHRPLRAVAATVLGGLRVRLSEAGQHVLIATLADFDPYMRAVAVRALGNLGEYLSGVGQQALIDALVDSDHNVREAAAQALGGLGEHLDKNGQQALIWALHDNYWNDDKKFPVRDAADWALRKAGERFSEEQWLSFLAMAGRDNWRLRAMAADALGGMGKYLSEAGQRALIFAIADKDWPVGKAAALAVGKMEEYLSEAGQQALIDALADDNWRLREAATEALGGFGEHLSIAGQEAIITALADKDKHVRAAAAKALGKISQHLSTAGHQALITALTDTDSDVRKAVSQALGRMSERISREQWRKILVNIDSDMRAKVLREMSEHLGDEQWYKFLIYTDRRLRKAATQILRGIGKLISEEGQQALVAALADADYDVREEATEALGELGEHLNEASQQALIAAVENNNWRGRQTAVQALGRLGERLSTEGERILISTLENADLYIKVKAATALGELGKYLSAKGQQALIVALADYDSDDDGNYPVQEAAKKALDRLDDRLSENQWRELLVGGFFWRRGRAAAEAAGRMGKRLSDAGQFALISTLASGESVLRTAASEALGKVGDHLSEAGQHALISALTDADPHVREEVVEALGKLGDHLSEAGQHALINALVNGENIVRMKVVYALRGLGDHLSKAGQHALILALANDESSYVRRPAAEALGKVGEHLSEAGQQALIAALGDGDSIVRASAAKALGELGKYLSETSYRALLAVLEDGDSISKAAAAKALEERGERLNEADQHIFICALVDADPDVRKAVAKALGECLRDIGQQALLPALTDIEPGVRAAAAQALGRMSDYLNGAGETALIMALADADPDVREAVTQALGELGERLSGAGQQALINALADTYEGRYRTYPVRQAAALALGKMGNCLSEAGQQALVLALEDTEKSVREVVVKVLEEIGERLNEEQWRKFLANGEWHVREAATRALEKMGERLNEEQWYRYLADGEWRVREAATRMLGKRGARLSNTGQQALIAALEDGDWHVREAAATALGEIGGCLSDAGQQALIAALADTYPDGYGRYPVRNAAAEALGKMGERLSDAGQQALVATLADANEYAREAAVKAMGANRLANLMQQGRGREFLAVLQGGEPGPILMTLAQVRIAKVIGDIGQVTPHNVETLDRLLDWQHWQVQEAAAEALGKLRRGIADETILKLLEKWRVREPRPVWTAVDDALAEILAEDLIED